MGGIGGGKGKKTYSNGWGNVTIPGVGILTPYRMAAEQYCLLWAALDAHSARSGLRAMNILMHLVIHL